jgi:cytosine/adenosine deaminase-related metal-dependent hydrolase
MRKISAQYVFTSSGRPLKRGIVITDSDNTIIDVEDTRGEIPEKAGTEFYNGIIIPGLVNCHSHLELSHLNNTIAAGTGLADFIASVRERREAETDIIISSARKADNEMYSDGIVACGDISNNSLTFKIKSDSSISYLTLIEVFGINPFKAQKRISEALETAAAAAVAGLDYHLTPHAVYSVSQTLFALIKQYISSSSITSLHFLESPDERELVSLRRGRLAESYRSLGITPDQLDTTGSHIEAALILAHMTGRLILVHNTCITADEINALKDTGNIWFCLCPSSNMHISGVMPPVTLLRTASDHIVIGTDSLASTQRLSILGEMRLLHEAAPDIPLDEIIRWGTINGARALNMSDIFGSVEPGKRPGLLLIEPVDLARMRLLPWSRVRRLL